MIDRPHDEIITTKLVYRVKTKMDGTKRFKARLVGKGFQQNKNFSYGEIHAPVAKMSTIRTFLNIACQKQIKTAQLDIKTAFLYTKLDPNENIYLEIPDGLEKQPDKVMKLKRAIYGLKQVPKKWNEIDVQ